MTEKDEADDATVGAAPATEHGAGSVRLHANFRDKDAEKLLFERRGVRITAAAFSFQDPTHELSAAPPQLLMIDQKVVVELERRLSEVGMCVVTCADDGVLLSLAHSVAARYVDWEHRELVFDTEEAVTFQNLTRIGLGHGRKVAFVFATSASPAVLHFLLSVPLHDADRQHAYKRLLRDNVRIVVLTMSPRLESARWSFPRDSRRRIEIDFVGPILRRHFPDRWEEMSAGVWAQFEHGVWGSTHEELLTNIEGHLVRGTFESEFGRQLSGERAHPRAGPPAGPNVEEMLSGDGRPVEEAVCFVACYFKRLSVDDFRSVLETVLGERVQLQSSCDRGSGDLASMPPKRLIQLWEAEHRRILRDCGVTVSGSRPPTVDFAAPGHHQSIQQLFEGGLGFAFSTLCDRVEAAALAFDGRRSIGEPATLVIARRWLLDPDRYDDTFLSRFVVPAAGVAAPGDARAFAVALDLLDSARRMQVLDRLVLLLTHAIQEQCVQLAEAVVKSLLNSGRHGDALFVLSKVQHPSFLPSRLLLLRRILDEGDTLARDNAYTRLFRWTLEGDLQTLLIVEAVRSWKDGTESPHSEVADLFLVDLSEFSMFGAEAAGVHPIASAISATESPERAALLIRHLATLAPRAENDASGPEGEDASLLRSFLWMLPKTKSQELSRVVGWLWSDVQFAWLASLYPRVAGTSSEQTADVSGTLFAGLVLADSWCALGDGNSPPSWSPFVRSSFSLAVAGLSREQRARLRGMWVSLESALLACLGLQYAHGSQPGERQFGELIRARWLRLRESLRALLQETSAS